MMSVGRRRPSSIISCLFTITGRREARKLPHL
jgi:hypothetical protein